MSDFRLSKISIAIVVSSLFSPHVFAYDFIVDNLDAKVTGSWKKSTYHSQYYADNYLTTEVGDGAQSVVWSTSLPGTGDYEIFYRLPLGHVNRPSVATYSITHADGQTEVSINQQDTNGQWISLGIYPCKSGDSCKVTLTNEVADGIYINADAIKFLPQFDYEPLVNLALNKSVEASSVYGSYQASKAVDGGISDSSRWISNSSNDWLKVNLGKEYYVQCAHLYSGWQEMDGEDAIGDFKLQYYNGAEWVDIPGASYSGNTSRKLRIVFDHVLYTKHIRLVSSSSSKLKIKELEVYGENGYDKCPAVQEDVKIPEILVNQSGYNLNDIKRFTAPTLDDGVTFDIYKNGVAAPVYSGTIENNIGDFSDFNPQDSTQEYVIKAGDLESDSFGIGPYWYQRVTYAKLMEFMNKARCYVGSDNSCDRGVVYRDDHSFSFEMSSLIAMYFANPSYYENSEPTFAYKASGPLDAMSDDAPDIVKLIHFVADRLMDEQVEQGLMKAQLVQFLYVYPYISQWVSQEDYQSVLDYLVPRWGQDNDLVKDSGEATFSGLSNQNMLDVVTTIGGYKGNLPPGFAIKANLMMYQVALREGYDDAEKYFDAAYAQTEWLINNVAWNSANTKGQRMSEHITMEALHYFMKMYPDRAPSGLKAKIQSWVDRAIKLSDNMWDFRKYDDDQWVIPEDYNEPGNVAGLPASLNAAIEFVDDEDAKRLRELSAAHLDAVFGRNPTGRHFSYAGPDDFEGVERGYYAEYEGGLAKLSGIGGKLDGAAFEAHFPFNPEAGQVVRVEAWVAFNTAWNAAIGYKDYAETKVNATLSSNLVRLDIQAPLNLDYSKVETGYAYVESASGDKEKVLITETSANAMNFKGSIATEVGEPIDGDGILQVQEGDSIEVSYGYDFLKNAVTLPYQ